jgi:hypothetical protein
MFLIVLRTFPQGVLKVKIGRPYSKKSVLVAFDVFFLIADFEINFRVCSLFGGVGGPEIHKIERDNQIVSNSCCGVDASNQLY